MNKGSDIVLKTGEWSNLHLKVKSNKDDYFSFVNKLNRFWYILEFVYDSLSKIKRVS